MLQATIKYPVSCYGIGVHSGQTVQMTFKPAKSNDGIVFVRTDISSGDNFVKASFDNVTETTLSTTISAPNKTFSISTIEHLMAAIWGSGVDNLIIEIDGPEVPIMDGSSKPFVFMLECAQKKHLPETRKLIKIHKEIYIENGSGGVSVVSPADKFSISLDIDFPSKAIGKQSIKYDNKELFGSEIASARTFGFVGELEYLRSIGLAKGASLDNAIGLDQDTILNHDGLRYNDEFVRHKLLDALGDFSLASCDIIGSFSCTKPGHAMNNQLLRKIFADPSNFSLVDSN
ncbi:MAG: UDP-3-O-acyl-N-acetylglucosamine deacetylase [Rickettsiaceae bacterium]|nr:UDP-3-O-acyl-N-acetylglucosamine deacetylase [Rickettsiaceae bacterium]